MTHRNPRRRRYSRTLDGTPFRAPFAAGVALATNPNRGARHAARLGIDTDLTVSIAAGSKGQRIEYAPLTVVTPLPDSLGRKSRSRSSYTI